MTRKLGKTLQAARASRLLSLREVERRTGIHNAHLSQIERGLIERPEISILFELAREYELDYPDLLQQAGYVGERAPSNRAVATAALRAVGDLTPQQQAEALGFIARLRRMPREGELWLTEEHQHHLASIADRALREADVLDVIPTPLDRVGELAGVAETIRDESPPPQVENSKPPWWKRVLGAVLFRERVVYINPSQGGSRARFTQAHEVSHMLLPWHEDVLRLDDERTLFLGTREQLEAEANWTGAHLIFQGQRYHDRALSDQVSIRTPIALASDYDASMHASIRFYVQHHPDPVAVLIAGRYVQHDGTLPIWNSFESPSFLARFGRLVDHVPRGALALDEDGSVLGRLAAEAFRVTDPPSEKLLLMDRSGQQKRFLAESFFNQYTVFLMVSPANRLRPGRRMRLAAKAERR
jgi:transcriptional regulator with XRE-family HTH domain